MAGLTDTVANAMLDNQFPAGSASLSLHSADPGATGLNELSGGSPAYARASVTLVAASGRAKTYSDGNETFNVPAGGRVAYVGYWISSTFKGSFPVASPQYFAAQGVYTLAPVTLRIP